jgi:hypothetical protein
MVNSFFALKQELDVNILIFWQIQNFDLVKLLHFLYVFVKINMHLLQQATKLNIDYCDLRLHEPQPGECMPL